MIKERLERLRRKMYESGLDAYYFNTQDYHMSEYIPEYFKTLRYFSGFTGSLAQFIVTFDEALIFVDGRYHVQADNECTPNGIRVMKLGTEGVLTSDKYMIEKMQGMKIGLDARCVDASLVKRLLRSGLDIKTIDIYSDIYDDRASLSKEMLYELDVKYTGLSRAQKLTVIKRALDGKCHVICDLASIAYLLNLRGNDIAYTPVFLSYMVFYKGDVYLFIDKERLSDLILEGLYRDGVIIRDYDDFYDFLKTMRDTIVLLDTKKVNYEAYRNIDASCRIYDARSIVEDMKSIKNKVEIDNTIKAHVYDGVAMVRFMKWLKETELEGKTEFDIKVKLDRFRLEYKAFDLSFAPIVAYGANAAMMHYSPKEDKCSKVHDRGMLLVDSGGQYFEGTTDITRTFALGEVDDEMRYWFTLVLGSMLELQSVKFLEGLCGAQLDILARKDLWELGVDYRCGTGHGVGHVLAVHETPPNIRYTLGNGSDVALRHGHIFSDEPGVYFEGKFGIRCENMLLCQKDMKTEYGQFLSFRPLTVVPFDLDLIDKRYLSTKNIKALNDYHAYVYEMLEGYLSEDEKDFLKKYTRAI